MTPNKELISYDEAPSAIQNLWDKIYYKSASGIYRITYSDGTTRYTFKWINN